MNKLQGSSILRIVLCFTCLFVANLSWLRREIVRRVEVYLRATNFVSLQHTERRRIHMDGDEVLSTDVGITKLMNVRYLGPRDRTRRTFATRVVTQATLIVVREHRFPHEPLMHPHDSVRSVVIVNGRLLSGAPTDHQHLDCGVTKNSMSPVITFFEADVRL